MLSLGTWTSELSDHPLFTINMVGLCCANNCRHSRRVVSGAEDESRPGEALRERIGSSECGSRASSAQVEERAANHPTSRSVEVAGKA